MTKESNKGTKAQSLELRNFVFLPMCLCAFVPLLVLALTGMVFCETDIERENRELREIISVLSTKVAPPAPGEFVSINFVDADLRRVIALLAEKYKINIYGGEKITGKITARLKDVPLEKLFEILLDANGFGMVKKGDAYYEIVTKADAEKKRLEKIVAGMEFRSFYVKYADLGTVQTLISSMGLLSSDCKVVLHPETSQMIIRATDGEHQKVEDLLSEVDVQPPQILIRARVVEINRNALDSMGIEWTADFLAGELGIGNVAGDVGAPQVGELSTFKFGLTHPKFNIDAAIEALVYRKVARVLTAPRLTTSNNVEATMTIADMIPVIAKSQTTSPEGTVTTTESVSFASAGLTLTILPKKVGINQILLDMSSKITQFTEYTDTDPPQPIIDNRETKNKVIIRHDQWLVIGGLITTNTAKMRRKIPLLGDIPLLGIAFSSRGTTDIKGDLLILVNARILDDESIGVDTKSSIEIQETLKEGGKPERFRSYR